MRQISRLAARSLESNFKSLGFPMKISLLLTDKCNAKCIMCNIWKKKDHSGELTTEEIETFFSKSGLMSWMDLSGGEIFLRPDIKDIIDIIYEHCKDLFLLHYATNGFISDRAIAVTEKALSYDPKKLLVTVSLDGPKELHEKIRGVPGVFEKTIHTFAEMRKLNRKNFKVFLGMTLFDENSAMFEKTFADVREIIPDISYDDFHLNIMQLSSHYYDNMDVSVTGRDQIQKTIKNFREIRGGSVLDPIHYLENKYQELADTFITTGKCPLRCQALSNSCFIGANGDIFPCTMYSLNVTNLRDHEFDLKKAWNSPDAVRIRNEIQQGRCPQCWTPCEAYQTIIGNFLKVRTNHS